MLEYHDRRAPEYDDWWNGTGLFAERDRPGAVTELDGSPAMLASCW
jgi:hypothetical protein